MVQHSFRFVYKPSTNGLAERMVQSFKASLRAQKHDSGTIHQKLATFLLMYRSTVNTTTQETPSMLFLKRNIKTRIQLAKPNPEDIVNRNTTSKEQIVLRSFSPGDEVLVRDYRKRHEKWISGSVIRKIGTLMYENLADGVTWKRHIDQIRDSIHPIKEKTVKTDTSVVNSLPNIHTPSVLERNVDTPPPFDTSVSSQTSISDNIDKRVTVQSAILESSIVPPEYVPEQLQQQALIPKEATVTSSPKAPAKQDLVEL